MLNGDWVGRAAVGAGVAFVVIGAGAAAFMGGDDARVEVRSEVVRATAIEAAEAPEAPAQVVVGSAGGSASAEGFTLSDLPRRIEQAITEGIEAELVASFEVGEFDLTIDGQEISSAEWRALDSAEREERLARLRAKVAELDAEASAAVESDEMARAAILERVSESLKRLIQRLEEMEG